MITSNIQNPIPPFGSDVTLNCTVELSQAVRNALVTVNTVWTGPDEFNTTYIAQPVMGSNTTYISTTTVASFGREQSGIYNCLAIVSEMQQSKDGVLSERKRITVGES